MDAQLGLQTVAAVQQKYEVSSDKALNAYVSRVGQAVAANSGWPYGFQFTVLKSPELNAFAAPGGYIFITTGLLSRLNDEAELAAVLGHEAAHVERRHSVKRIQRAAIAQFGLSAITGWVGEGSAQLASQIGGIAANLLMLRNSREAELESDEYGMRYAAKQGYDAAGMIRVQQTLLAASGGGGYNPVAEMLATHPSSHHRIEQATGLLPASSGGRREEAAYRKATAGLRP
jgi:predicted Zn-dependent protease